MGAGTKRVEAVVDVGAKYPRWLSLAWLVAGVRAAVVASVKRLWAGFISSLTFRRLTRDNVHNIRVYSRTKQTEIL